MKLSLQNFTNLTLEHRSRLIKSLDFLMSEQKALSDERQFFKDYFEFHDLPKVQSVSELQSFGYRHEKSIGDRLNVFYGRNKHDLALHERYELTEVISDLNRIELLQKNAFLRRVNKHESPTLSTLFQIEHFLDVFDTHHFRAKEFGIHDPHHLQRSERFLIHHPELQESLALKWQVSS